MANQSEPVSEFPGDLSAARQIDAEALAQTEGTLGRHLFRFVISGGLSACVDFGLTLFLQFVVGTGYPVAKAVGFFFGTLTAYMINRRWTFQAEASTKRFLVTMALYVLMFGVQWGLAVSINHGLVDQGVAAFWAGTIGFVIGQGVATTVNFIVQRWVIFR